MTDSVVRQLVIQSLNYIRAFLPNLSADSRVTSSITSKIAAISDTLASIVVEHIRDESVIGASSFEKLPCVCLLNAHSALFALGEIEEAMCYLDKAEIVARNLSQPNEFENIAIMYGAVAKLLTR